MNAKSQIRPLSSESEEDAFKKIVRYCFNDLLGWSERIFPLRFGDRAYGAFSGSVLESALMTRAYDSKVFGTWQKMSGISFVESLPEHRNKDNISGLMKRALVEERDRGAIFSTLYPFKFRYYEKYGYGYVGGFVNAAFQPDDIAAPAPSGEFIPFGGTDSELGEMTSVYGAWVSQFSFGIKPRPLPPDDARAEIEWSKDRIVLYYENGKCKGFLRMLKVIDAPFLAHLEVRKIAWADEAAFMALMYFLKKHRDQIREVKWQMPPSLPLALVTCEPRIQLWRSSDWMARPLDLRALVALKAKANETELPIVFSVRDPELPENTGTYTIEGNDVRKADYTGVHEMPLPILSTLLFGGWSLSDAKLAGRVSLDLPAEYESFFSRETKMFISEYF
jgi:predicted acetyltransferase